MLLLVGHLVLYSSSFLLSYGTFECAKFIFTVAAHWLVGLYAALSRLYAILWSQNLKAGMLLSYCLSHGINLRCEKKKHKISL